MAFTCIRKIIGKHSINKLNYLICIFNRFYNIQLNLSDFRIETLKYVYVEVFTCFSNKLSCIRDLRCCSAVAFADF